MSKLTAIAFLLLVVAQWVVPGKMIYDSENTLVEGEEFKFKTQPIDPSDPFRGSYITLYFEANECVTDTVRQFDQGQSVYVSIITDSTGYAAINGIYDEIPPELNIHLIKATVAYTNSYGGEQHISVDYPFERFYLEESKASEAEQLYWENQRDTAQSVYALVKVKDHQAVLKDVMINNKSIIEIVKELNQSPN